jgi:3-deoxy-D-manno-octulosonic acid (KDO) 8-phosphate synthase
VTETGVPLLNDSTHTDELNKTRTTESSQNNSFDTESRLTVTGVGIGDLDTEAGDNEATNDSNGKNFIKLLLINKKIQKVVNY